ncbi:D-serine ammonia-lyase [Arcobacter sp. HD9-500m-PIT-SAG03]|nr:D-serine ammonia-lyase [Arcobacter sp. HD9-500m-PIT-SAG03]
MNTEPLFWANPKLKDAQKSLNNLSINKKDLEESSQRLNRFEPFLSEVFSELKNNGIIESKLLKVDTLQNKLSQHFKMTLPGNLYLKCDHQLPISGAIKARGGFYEILKLAEKIALSKELISVSDDYSILTNEACKKELSKYSIVVGSTGNLGLSIGIMSKKIGFKVTVHMSSDAKKWKKDKLRDIGVTVIEHKGDYEVAVTAGRMTAKGNEFCHFIDDENSLDLFMGYAVAALRLEQQLKDQHIIVDKQNPLFVYLPCGVGGAPGGISWGLKTVFKNNVHCFFAEPTHSPAMFTGLYTGLHDKISINNLGIDNQTQADGLAVGRPSGFVGKTLEHLINGCYTLSDDSMFELLALTYQTEGLTLEPSATAGIQGIKNILSQKDYLIEHNLEDKLNNITHIAWTTGGDMVPKKQMDEFIGYGKKLLIN